MRLLPINDRVLVRRVDAERVTPGGIHLLEDHKTGEGEVAGAGPDASVQKGDRVLFAHGRHETTTFEGEELLVLRDEDLLAVLEEKVPLAHGLDLGSDEPLARACDAAGLGEGCESCQ